MVAVVSMDQTGFQQGLTRLNRGLKVVQSEFKASSARLGDFGKSTEGLKLKADSLTKQLDIQRQRVHALAQSYKESVDKKGADAKASQNLEIELNKARAEMSRMENDLKRTTAQLEKQSSAWNKLSQNCQKTGEKMASVGKNLTTYVSVPLAGMGVLTAKAAVDIESAFAGVRKTVDATEKEFGELQHGFKSMAKEIPVTVEGLMLIGERAGQLGIQTENILGFTDVMAKLGVTTNLAGDQAAMSLARLANIMQMPQDQFDRLGSTIVHLGNNLATTESEIAEMGLRIAGAGNVVGMTEANVLSFAGALSSLGIEAEAGGSAISRVLLDINSQVASGGENLQIFASVAGMSAQEFANQWKSNAAVAFVAFIEGLQRVKESGQDVVPILDELGFSQIRTRDALLRSAGAGDVFAQALELGSKAWEDNIALNKEAEERFKTTASQLQILKNNLKIAAAAFGDVLLPAINSVVQVLIPILNYLEGLPEPAKKTAIAITTIAIATGPLLWGLGTVLTQVPKVKSGFDALVSGAKKLGVALRFLVTNPIGLVITGLALLVAGGIALYKNWDVVKAYSIKVWGQIKYAILTVITAILAAMEKLYGWIPKLGDSVRTAAAAARSALQEEAVKMQAAQEEFQRVRGSSGGWADFRQLESESQAARVNLSGLQFDIDDTVSSFDGLGAAAGGAGGSISKAAEEAKTSWVGTSEALKSALSTLQVQHEMEIMRAEMAGNNVEMLRLKYRQLSEQISYQKEVVAATRGEVEKAIEAGVLEGETTEDLAKRIDELNNKLADEEKVLVSLEKEMYDNSNAMKEQGKNAKDLAEELKKVVDTYQTDMVKALEEYQSKVKETNEELLRDTQELQQELDSKLEDIAARGAERERQVTDQYKRELENRTRSLMDFVGLFDEVVSKEVSGDVLLRNLEDQVSAFESWQEDIAALMTRGVDEGLIQELREMGPRAAPEIAALNTLTDEQLSQYVVLWKQRQEQARVEAVAQLEQQRQEMNQELRDIREDTRNQLEQQRKEMAQKLEEMQAKAKEELEKYKEEWEKKNEEIRKNTEKNIQDIYDRFNELVGKSTEYGVSLIENFMDGIDSAMPDLIAQLEGIANMIDSYMPHSPAKRGPLRKIMEWGPSMIGSLIDGIKSALPQLESVMDKAAMLSARALRPMAEKTYNTSNKVYHQGGNEIHITVQDGEDLLRTLHRLGVRIP